jgi:hypothetical protein
MLEALLAVAIAEDEAGVDRLPAQCLDLGNRIHPLHREFDAGMLAAKFTEAVEHDKTVVDPDRTLALPESGLSRLRLFALHAAYFSGIPALRRPGMT